jgi:hypothetical protein
MKKFIEIKSTIVVNSMEDYWDELKDSRLFLRFMGGCIIGGITGVAIGAIDAAGAAGLNKGFQVAVKRFQDPTIRNFFFRQQFQTAGILCIWSGAYQSTKYLVERNLSEYTDDSKEAICGSSMVVSALPFLPLKVFRRNIIWVGGMAALDYFNGGLK